MKVPSDDLKSSKLMIIVNETKVTPKDGLFCALSINDKHSQYESSV